MTPKERRDAQIELRDMARGYEEHQSVVGTTLDDLVYRNGQRMTRARMLRAVAAELDRVPEGQ